MTPFAFLCPRCRRLGDSPGVCARCRRERAAARNQQPHRAIYRDRRWRRARRVCLARDGWRCRVIEDGRRCPVTDRTGRGLHAHHHPLSVRELLARGLDPFDAAHLVTVCHSHHSRLEAAAPRSAR